MWQFLVGANMKQEDMPSEVPGKKHANTRLNAIRNEENSLKLNLERPCG